MPILQRRTRTVYRTDQSFGVPFELNKDSDCTFPGGTANPVPARDNFVGKSFLFDNSNDYISAGDVEVLDFASTDAFSISVWCKTGQTAPTSFHLIDDIQAAA